LPLRLVGLFSRRPIAAKFTKRTNLGNRNEINHHVTARRALGGERGGLAKQTHGAWSAGVSPAVSLRRAGGTPALRLRVLAEQSRRHEADGPGRDFGRTISGENAKEISSLISAGLESAKRGLEPRDLQYDTMRVQHYAKPAK
jgi:hypothetical protein